MEDNNRQSLILFTKISCVIISILRKWRFIILIALVCGTSFDVVKTMTYVPQYASSATAILSSDANSYSQLENALGYIDTIKYIFNGQIVEDYIKEKMQLEELDLQCNITSINNTNIIRIQATSTSRAQAYHALNYMEDWYQLNKEYYQFPYDFKIQEKNSMSMNPINPNSHIKNFRNGAIISGILIIGILGIFSYLKDTIKTHYDIDHKIESRLFAKIPKEIKSKGKKFFKKSKQGLLITSLKTSFHYKESIKKLRNRIEESSKKHNYKTIMITSSLENEGKSSIAANLAISLAQNDHRVLLIDGDIRKPSVHKLFNVKTDLSLNQYIKEGKYWNGICLPLGKYKLDLIVANQELEHAEKYIQSDKMKQLIEEASTIYDYVIVDTSPARYLNEPIIMNEYVDATLLVIKQDSASIKVINETINKLNSSKNNIIGCIYNASVVDLIRHQKMYGYRYGYNRYTK